MDTQKYEKSELKIIDNTFLSLTGVKKMGTFDNKCFKLETNFGDLIITGKDMELQNLDTVEGKILIKGKIRGLNYVDSIKEDKESLISKLFK